MALEMIDKFETNHPSREVMLNNIAESYSKQNLPEKSIPIYMECIVFQKDRLDPESLLYAIPYCNLAISLYRVHLFEAAKSNMDKGILIFELNHLTEHPDYADFKTFQFNINRANELMSDNIFKPSSVKISLGRNELCYCASGKKYKYCCGQ